MDRTALENEPPTAYQPNAPLRQPLFVPPEVWVEIFMSSLPPIHCPQAPQKTAIALVCRLWNVIVESTPVLWTRITVADNIPYVRRSLSKSGECPIDVHGVFQMETKVFDYLCNGICCQFIREVQSHAQRWRDVALQVLGCVPSATLLPSLASFKLYSNHYLMVRSEYLTLLDCANAPHIHQVLLHGTRLARWDISFSSTLSKLEIHSTVIGPLSVELLSILSACPNLTVLGLRKVYPRSIREDDRVDGSPSDCGTVELATLRELTLDGGSIQLAQDLLQKLKLPEQCIISLKCKVEGSTPSTSFLTPVLAHCPGGFQRAEKVGKMTIRFTSIGFHLIVVHRQWKINLKIRRVGALRDALQWFGASVNNGNGSSTVASGPTDIATSNGTPVLLKFAALKSEPTDNPRIDISSPSFTGIADLGCITRIKSLRLRTEQQVSLFLYLSQPEHQDDPTTMADRASDPGAHKSTTMRWPFPGLCELVVKGMREDVLKAVMGAVKNRSSGNREGGLVGPARLKRVEFVDECGEVIRNDEHSLASEPTEAQRGLLIELFGGLDDDAEVVWGGKSLSRNGSID